MSDVAPSRFVEREGDVDLFVQLVQMAVREGSMEFKLDAMRLTTGSKLARRGVRSHPVARPTKGWTFFQRDASKGLDEQRDRRRVPHPSKARDPPTVLPLPAGPAGLLRSVFQHEGHSPMAFQPLGEARRPSLASTAARGHHGVRMRKAANGTSGEHPRSNPTPWISWSTKPYPCVPKVVHVEHDADPVGSKWLGQGQGVGVVQHHQVRRRGGQTGRNRGEKGTQASEGGERHARGMHPEVVAFDLPPCSLFEGLVRFLSIESVHDDVVTRFGKPRRLPFHARVRRAGVRDDHRHLPHAARVAYEVMRIRRAVRAWRGLRPAEARFGAEGFRMVDQLPNRGLEAQMLAEMGLDSIDDLFSDVPVDVRMHEALPLPPPQSEEEIIADARRLLGANVPLGSMSSFVGAGLYRNHVPAAVFQLVTRGEFLTAYTPYQAEVSQGMLQAMWEFQTLISELVGLPVANLSVYDGSSAAAEAITCAVRVHNRKASQPGVVYVSELVPPDRRSVIHNYTQGGGIEIRLLPHGEDGLLDLEAVKEAAGACAVYVEQPNPLGLLDEGLVGLKEALGEHTALIVGVHPISLGLYEAPGHYGADIVVGEGQPLGSPMTAGGPIYGFFACSAAYMRQMPGRIVGRTIDVDGNTAYCLTLSTREQHIRRHRATSNLCTNETLIALMGAMHMALLGPEGLRMLALRNAAAAEATKRALAEVDGVAVVHANGVHFNEFALRVPGTASACISALEAAGVLPGFDLGRWDDDRADQLLVTATDQTSTRDIQRLAKALEGWCDSQAGVVA